MVRTPFSRVVSNAKADPLAESGGEESEEEEEWNYIPGKDTKPDSEAQEQDDMSSQLNPDAAEFVPVAPTHVMMLDDAIISASPRLGFETSLDEIQMPTELEFDSEIAQRPGDLEMTNGSKHGDDYFMRDNFSTLRNKGKDFNTSSTCAELGDEPVKSLNSSVNSTTAFGKENIPFDKLNAVQNLEEQVSSCITENANVFETETLGATNILSKSDPMTTSVMGLIDLTSSPEQEDIVLPGTPKSTIVEAPASPVIDDVSPLNQQTDVDSTGDDYIINTQKSPEPKSPELMSPGECPQDGLISGQERTSSSGFESESGAEEGETNVEENNVGFITEHRKSPPIDLTFKPIQTFSDTNPFGALQTPTSTTPLDQFDVNTLQKDLSETKIETPKKDVNLDNLDFGQNTPSSFVSLRRTPHEEVPVSFDDLESPKDIPQFVEPPNANSSFLASELSKSPEPLTSFEKEFSPIKKQPMDSTFDAYLLERESSVIAKEDLPSKLDVGVEETTFTTDNSNVDKEEASSKLSLVDLDTTERFLIEESKILQEEESSGQSSKLNEDVNVSNPESCHEAEKALENDNSQKIIDEAFATIDDTTLNVVGKVLAVVDDIKDIIENKSESHEEDKVSDSDFETKEMKLEFESHINDSKLTPDELKNLDDSFEVINKEELTIDENICNAQVSETRQFEVKESELSLTTESGVKESEPSLPVKQPLDIKQEISSQENFDLLSPSNQTNPFVTDDSMTTQSHQIEPEGINVTEHLPSAVDSSSTLEKSSENDLMSAIDSFSSAVEENVVKLEQPTLLSSVPDASSPLEPQATKTVSYQTLTPADEPKITKSSSYVTGIEEDTPTKSPIPEEIVPEVAKAEESPVLKSEPLVEVAPTPVETTPPVADEQVVTKVEPVQSQVVTETLITALEETSEVPSMATTEVPSTTETPPPTPAPGVDSKDDSQKTDILVAAVAAAGAVAAGSAVVAEKKSTAASKKPLAAAPKKPSDQTAKPSGKLAPNKTAPAAKPATKTNTSTKPASTATKPAVTTAAAKPPAAKPTGASTVPKKPAVSALKPSAAKLAPKPAAASSNQVPKQLSVNKTAMPTQKGPSKPTTPTSKPTTPTTPKSPGMGKVESVKSPPRPITKTTVGSPKPSGAADKPTEKKPLLNGEIKSLAKKPEAPIKRVGPTATKATTTAKPPAKPTPAPAKPAASTATKTATAKPTSTTLTKSNPKTTTAKAPVTTATKRPSATTKTTDKTGKETANKQISSTKPAVNGKNAPAKPTDGLKKTDAKVNGKASTEKNPVKKSEIKKVEEPISQIQEDNVTTTNGFAEHIIGDHQNTKIEELASVIVDGLN